MFCLTIAYDRVIPAKAEIKPWCQVSSPDTFLTIV